MMVEFGNWLMVFEGDDERAALDDMIDGFVYPLRKIEDSEHDIFKQCVIAASYNPEIKDRKLLAVYLTYYYNQSFLA